MPTQSEAQLPVYSSLPADLAAVTCTTGASNYLVGYTNGPGSTTLTAASAVGAMSLTVAAITNFYVGEAVLLEGGTATAELAIVTSIATLTLNVVGYDGGPLQKGHANSGTVVGTSAAITPIASGRVNIAVMGTLTSNNTGDTMKAQIVVIDATKQASIAAGTGYGTNTSVQSVGNQPGYTALTGVLTQAFACAATLGATSATNSTPSGGAVLKVGNPYIIDLGVQTTTAGKTVQAKTAVWQIEEV